MEIININAIVLTGIIFISGQRVKEKLMLISDELSTV